MTSLPWRGRNLVKTTGGSTGDPFRFEYTMESYARRTAVMWRGYEWAGAGPGARTASLWATPPPQAGWRSAKERAYHWLFNRKFLDAFGMNRAEYPRLCAFTFRIRSGCPGRLRPPDAGPRRVDHSDRIRYVASRAS